MVVFSDLHHGDLYYSLQLLFEKRLGWTLLRPIGTDWFTQGYWKLAEVYGNHPDTIRQFLGLDVHKWEAYKFLNGDYKLEDGVYHIYDPIHDIHQKAITFEQFKQMDIDLVISSYQPHDLVYADLISKYKPKAKHIAQMGNIYQTTQVKNVMCSTMPYPVESDKNVVFYHQEFDLETFKYTPPTGNKKITSFVHCLPRKEQYELFKLGLPEYKFKSHGAGCPDNPITGAKNVAQIMSESMFGYHVKPGGDGFGHTLHSFYACGRPVLIGGNDYRDKLAGNLLQDGVTCIDLDKHSFNENINLIRYHSEPERHKLMCENAYKRFKEVVDYDQEEAEIRKFLEKII